ncbi:MAG: SAM-dependent methyltransferase [Beijerinckiaceae bacterium]
MIENQFSRTARGAALHRAAHQTFEQGAIFQDPLACAILGLTPVEAAAEAANDDHGRRMRLFVAARARFAEDCLAQAVRRGVRQAVVLGAGLDTFGLRNPHAGLGLRVFEVDHPDTQAWKRERLAAMGQRLPESLTFAPVDFERDSFLERLATVGFDMERPAFFVWLGVTPYLTREATLASLAAIGSIPGGEVAFDYTEGRKPHEGEGLAFHDRLTERVAALGEPIVGALDPQDLAKEAAARGLTEQEDLDISAIRVRYFGAPPDPAQRTSSGHLFRARRPD